MTSTSPPTSTADPEVFVYELRIPRERIAVLVGTKGSVKRRIETETHTKIEIDSKEGDVFVEGKDMVALYVAREIIRGIGRGFNPDVALLLLRPEYNFELISLNDYSTHKNHQSRMKSRIIGTKGKTRSVIEQTCECYVSIYGKTIAVIGEVERCHVAVRAIEQLLEGATHASVYKWLDDKRRTLVRQELGSESFADEVKDDFKKYVDD